MAAQDDADAGAPPSEPPTDTTPAGTVAPAEAAASEPEASEPEVGAAVEDTSAEVDVASPPADGETSSGRAEPDAAADTAGPETAGTDTAATGGAAGDDGEEEEAERVDPHRGLAINLDLGGTYQLRGIAMSDIPLMPGGEPVVAGGDTIPDRLGQNYWAEQYMRLRFSLGISDASDADGDTPAAPFLRFVGEGDVFFGVAFGELAQGTRPAAWARDDYGYPGLRLRHLYLEWTSDVGVLRVGQMGFTWGLGLVANDGATPPPFGDYRFGDLVRRVVFATRPFGRNTPFNIAGAFDWVAWDITADADRPCLREGQSGGIGLSGCGDLAFQGVIAAFFQENENVLGGYVAYRTQWNYLQDYLDVFVGDLFGRWYFDEPSGGRIFIAAEAAAVIGSTSMTRTATRPTTEVQQFLAAVQIGRREHHVDVVLEGGFATGDSNTEDGFERRGTMDPDHRIGLVLFPEVIAWQTARAAFLATAEETFGRPSRGAELIPTNGGVSGAFYLFPTASWRPWDFLEGRLGAVLGFASADIVDPYRQRSESRSVNFRGGNPGNRDYGVEIDAAILAHGEIASGVELNGGIEGGILFPGHAFDDENGRTMSEVGMARLRLGISF